MQSAGWRILLPLAWVLLVISPAAWASGTPAGTLIPNSATLHYLYKGQPQTAVAVSRSVVVARVINLVLNWQDLAALPVLAGDSARVLTFVLTNTGNGTETFRLVRNNTVAGDAFQPLTPAMGAIYLESGAEPGLQTSGPNADVLYVPGVNDVTLAADASRVLYIPSDIPVTPGEGARGRVNIEALSTTPGVAGAVPGAAFPGTPLPGQPTPPLTVVGMSRGQATAVGGYVVHGLLVNLDKSVTNRRDPKGGTQVMSGTELTYRIVLTVSGTGTIGNLNFTDPLPASLAYVPGSLMVDGTPRTDVADGDQAAFAGGVVSATFGDVAAPAVRTVEFKAVVN